MGMTGSERAADCCVCAVAAAPPAMLLDGGPLPVTVSSRYVVVMDGVFGDCKRNELEAGYPTGAGNRPD